MFVAAVLAGQKTDSGRAVRDRLFLNLPLIGTIVRYAVVERFCRILGAMVKAGVSLPEAVSASIQGANNTVFARKLHPAQERMLEGDGLADPLAQTQLLPRAALQMIRVGESTGTLEIQLDNAAAYYARELEYTLKRLPSLFEPMVILFMGFVVGFVAVALISAMYGVFSTSQIA
jgi:type IV pilus assembly protein PilC